MPTRRWGSETLVNATTAGEQRNADVTALAGGGFVIVWEDESAGPDASIRAQIYNALGNPVGGELVVAPRIASNDLFQPKVTGLADGNFYVSWTQNVGSENYIYGRVYDAGGDFVRNQTVVFANTQVVNGDLSSFGTGAADAWVSPTGGGDIYLRLFDAAGVGGNLITVDDYPDGYEEAPVVAASPDGSTVAVVWNSGESGDTSVNGRLYDTNGGLITSFEVVYGGDTGGYVDAHAICWLNDSQFVVAWRNQLDYINHGPGDILLRLFNFNGASVTQTPFTDIVLANATTLGQQDFPVITALPSGGFVVAWVDYSESNPDGDGAAIRLQAFDGSGGRIGGEIVVNTTTSGDQINASIAALPDGRVVVTWTDDSSGNSDIRSQIVDPRDGLVTGTGGNDTLYGHDLVNDELFGGAGQDNLFGLRGDDALYGGQGNDVLNGQAGNDLCFGGSGNDTINGGLQDDGLYGQGGNDTLIGQGGNDTLNGGSGNDTLNGGDGNDTLNGGSGNDSLLGGYGDDTLAGDTGQDFMRGGPGFDTFDFNKATDSAAGVQRDHIIDFSKADDLIDLSGIDAKSGVGGNQAFHFIGSTAFSGTKGELRAVNAGENSIVAGDVNGDSQADFSILVEDVQNLHAADFNL